MNQKPVMASSISNLLSFSFLLLDLVMLITKVESQNSTSFNISAFTPDSLLLTYERDAFVSPTATNVRLVRSNVTSGSVGRVLYSAPVQLWEASFPRRQASFDTTITFQISPATGGSFFGMTFFMVPVNSTTTSGGSGTNLGIYDAVIAGSAIFAVEFDISVDPFDPPYPHIGININSPTSQNTTSFPNAIRNHLTARITYDVPTRMISVVVRPLNATVSFAFNLMAVLPQQVQVGLSASTGPLPHAATNFDVFTWQFNSTMVSDVNSVVDDNTYIKKYVM